MGGRWVTGGGTRTEIDDAKMLATTGMALFPARNVVIFATRRRHDETTRDEEDSIRPHR
jgi:hypothetical protein